MKRSFILFIYTIFLCIFFLSCQNEDSGSSYSVEQIGDNEGFYLVTTETGKRVCYKYFDEENLRKKTLPITNEEFLQAIRDCRIKRQNFGSYSVPNNYCMISVIDFDLIGFNWSIISDFDGFDGKADGFSFREDGSVEWCDWGFKRYIGLSSNTPHFITFKIFSEGDKFYLNFYLFCAEKENSFYGGNLEKLTAKDLKLKSVKKFLYQPVGYTFTIIACDE